MPTSMLWRVSSDNSNDTLSSADNLNQKAVISAPKIQLKNEAWIKHSIEAGSGIKG